MQTVRRVRTNMMNSRVKKSEVRWWEENEDGCWGTGWDGRNVMQKGCEWATLEMTSSGWTGRYFTTCWGDIYPSHSRSKWMGGWRCPQTTRRVKPKYFSMEHVHEEERKHQPWGALPHYLHVGEGAGQGACTWPPLLLQSSAQHLKLPFLLPHRGQQGGRARTLLHSHAESRAEDRQDRAESTPESREPSTRGQTTQRTDQEPWTHSEASAQINVLIKPTQVEPAWERRREEEEVPRKTRRKEDEREAGKCSSPVIHR